MMYQLILTAVPCKQCSTPHTGPYAVCDNCIHAAQVQLEGALGGRLDSFQVARIFDMGGAGMPSRGCHVGRPSIQINWDKL